MKFVAKRRWVLGASIIVAAAMATPAVASAQPSPARTAKPASVASNTPFPSASSTVVGSVGFINSTEVGYFWSVSRGDKVEQTVSGPVGVRRAILRLDVVENALAGGAEVDWTLSVNGTDVGSFAVTQGQTGNLRHVYRFPVLHGGSYDVKIRVTNEVPGGDGSMTLAYAGSGAHSIALLSHRR